MIDYRLRCIKCGAVLKAVEVRINLDSYEIPACNICLNEVEHEFLREPSVLPPDYFGHWFIDRNGAWTYYPPEKL